MDGKHGLSANPSCLSKSETIDAPAAPITKTEKNQNKSSMLEATDKFLAEFKKKIPLEY